MILYDKTALLDFPRFGISIPSFDSRKTNIIEALKQLPQLKGRQWLTDHFDDVLTAEDLKRAHNADYADGFFDERAADRFCAAFELRTPGGELNRWNPDGAASPLSEMTPLMLKMTGGTYRCARIALDKGFCFYPGGGAHHGHAAFGHGFCPVNDTAVAVRKLQAEGRISRVWVIDLDAHKGDGTAAIFSEDRNVYTLSIHMARGWPLDGSLPANHPSYTPSNYDIPVESGEEHLYLDRLLGNLEMLKNEARPDLAIVLAGADPWEGDALPSASLLKLSAEQMLRRDQMTWRFLQDCGIPSAWLMAGGYGEDSWTIHAAFLKWVLPLRQYPARS